MQHIDVFILAKYGKEFIPCLNDDQICRILTDYYEFPFDYTDLKRILEFPPKAKHLVKALRDKGFTQAKISQLTGLTQSTVSYHLNSETKKSYVNPYLDGKIRYFEQKKLQNESY